MIWVLTNIRLGVKLQVSVKTTIKTQKEKTEIMWRITCYENNGSITKVVTDNDYYARERVHCYDIAKKCNFIKDYKVEEVPYDTDELYRRGKFAPSAEELAEEKKRYIDSIDWDKYAYDENSYDKDEDPVDRYYDEGDY